MDGEESEDGSGYVQRNGVELQKSGPSINASPMAVLP